MEAIERGAPAGKIATDSYTDDDLTMEIGVTSLPHFRKDTTDRNRTSPFAFTGNKFEFRMLGSMFSVAGPNIVLNTIVAEVLRQFAALLENSNDFKNDLAALIKKNYRQHKRIVFNGNNYSDEWVKEAASRGLSNLKTTVCALPQFISEKSIKLFTSHSVFTESEVHSRYEILMEGYCKTIHIEALTMVDMIKSEIIPSCVAYQDELAGLLTKKQALSVDYDITMEEQLLRKISKLSACLVKKLETLENRLLESKSELDRDILNQAIFYRDGIFNAMSELRVIADELETLIARKHRTLPTYAEMLYSVV
jgi:glutamine synthetase